MHDVRLTYIGGPTLLIEIDGVRLLTDPTFDAAGAEYPTGRYTLRKLAGPALDAASLGRIDAVLLSHDHHFDNLDHSGRALLARAGTVLTTTAGAARLGPRAVGLEPWQSVAVAAPDGSRVRVSGTPARHGPPGGDRGPVTGFVVTAPQSAAGSLYISGDTVWYERVAEVAQRFRVAAAALFMGAARVVEVGPAHLTLTAEEAVQAAYAFDDAIIIPLHYEGWAHLSESRAEIQKAFAAGGVAHRLQWLEAGHATQLMQNRRSSVGSARVQGRSAQR